MTRLGGVGKEITFLRNLIKIGRFTFRVQKFNSLFSLVTERDFVISLIFSCLSQNFPQPSVLGAIMKENLVLNFPLQRLDATRRPLRVPILLWLFCVVLRVILGCLTSLLPSSSYSHVMVTRPSYFVRVPSYFEALWYPHLYFDHKSNI